MTEEVAKEPVELTEVETRARNPVIAFLFSICPGLGQQYAGHIVRGISLYFALIVVSWLAAIMFMYIESKISIIFLAVPFVGVLAIAVDAYLLAKKQPANYRLKWFNKPVMYVGVFLLLMVTVNPIMDMVVGQKIVRAAPIWTNSMSPTILKYDLVLVNKLAKPQRGDIVMLDFRGDAGGGLTKVMESQLIRRIVAAPGDTIELRNQDVFLNGEKLDESYAFFGPATASQYTLGPVEVPPGSYFVLSDNRTAGFDSRMLGFVDERKVSGVVTKVFWSWNFDDGGIQWGRTAMSLKQ